MSFSQSQIEDFRRDGYVCPITIFSENEARELRAEFEALEKLAAGQAEQIAALRNKPNWVVPWFDQLSRTPAIVESVASVLGPDLLIFSVDLFVKEPQTKNFISWHQDLHYWGLDADDEVTAWLALSPATPASGCMRYLPGSHRDIVEHRDTFADGNMLTRGQELAVEVDEDKTVFAALQPGQISLHHGRMFHASTANQSDERRIGIAMRFITPAMGRATDGDKLGAMLVRGEDQHGNFDLVTRPTTNFSPTSMQEWQRLRAVEETILYQGVDRAS